jgi:two-component system cell cycle response regulator
LQVKKGVAVQGTILIIDGVATNRIMLKVQLTAAYYHVVQAGALAGLADTVRRTRPDLILCAMTLPDGTAQDLKAILSEQESTAAIPVIALACQSNRHNRLAALAAGIEDVLEYPLDDVVLQARIRSLIRTYSDTEEMHRHSVPNTTPGFAEAIQPLSPAHVTPDAGINVALVAQNAATAAVWRARLEPHVPYCLRTHQLNDMQTLMSEPVPDAVVLEIDENACGAELRLLADLRARTATRQTVIIAVPNPASPLLAAEALDRGAHDAMQAGFCVDELALRLRTQLRLKAHGDRLRSHVRDGLKAAVTDPMTGLYNRRYALPWLARMSRQALDTRQSFAVFMADLDHFKSINDCYGHQAGDAVLVETARRLQASLGPNDLAARVGGEEFMIAMTGIAPADLRDAGERLRRAINQEPFHIPGIPARLRVTVSIGGAPGPLKGATPGEQSEMLIGMADRALYAAKHAGRDRVTLAAQQAA